MVNWTNVLEGERMSEQLFKKVLKNEFTNDDLDWLLANGYFKFRKTDHYYYHMATREFTFDGCEYIEGGGYRL